MNLSPNPALPIAMLIALGASPLRAQSSAAAPPAAPVADEPPPAPALALLDRVSLVAAPADWLGRLPERVTYGLVKIRCEGLAEPAMVALGARAREALVADGAPPSGTLTLQVAALPPSNDACAMQGRFSPEVVAGGISLVPAGAFQPTFDPDSVVVRVAGTRVMPLASSRRALLTPRAAGEPNAHLVSVRIPDRALDPDSVGRLPAVMVEVFLADGHWGAYDLDSAWVARAWTSVAWSRAASLAALAPGAPRPRLPEASDPDVRRADQRLAEGDLRGAATLLITRLRTADAGTAATALESDERVHANTVVAAALAAGGDSTAWRPFVRDALRDAPCLDYGPSVPAGPRQLAGALRAPASECAPHASDASRLAGWLPGRGDVSAGRVLLGRTVGAGSLGLFGASLAAAMRGASQHATYEAARDGATAAASLQQANDSRRLSGQLFAGGLVLWLGDALIARVRDRAHDAAVARVTGYGR